ncbi:MAG: hypothetical protein WD077_04685 [Bacteroidia bacterium]
MRIGRFTFRKLKQRGNAILLNSLHLLLVPALNFLLYILVVRLYGPTVWGSLVGLLLAVNLAVHFTAWGNKQFLLRNFSLDPQMIRANWQEAFFTRLPLLAVPAIIFLLFYAPAIAGWMILWLCVQHLFHSFEVFVVYQKRFIPAILADVAGFIILAAGIYFFPFVMEKPAFSGLFTLSFALKALIMAVTFYMVAFRPLKMHFNFNYFKNAFPFFLLGLVGLLQEKIDLYLMALIGTDEGLGKYHVLISALALLKSGSVFLLMPYIRNVYRLPSSSLRMLARRLSGAGVVIILSGVLAMSWLMPRLFHFDFDWWVYGIGGLYALPHYYYLVLTYKIFRQKNEKVIVTIGLAATIFNTILSLLLIPELGFKGALLATAAAEWLILGIIFWWDKKTA